MNRDTFNPLRLERARCSRKATGLALLVLFAAHSPGQDLAPGDPNLTVYRSSELHYPASAGQVFELQGSHDLGAWRHVSDVEFGEGKDVSDLVSPDRSRGGYQFYRVKVSPSKNFGFAPRNLPGKQLRFNDEGDERQFDFTSRSAGTAAGETIAYSYHKLGDTFGRIDIVHGGDETESIELDFSADLVGSYRRKILRGDAIRDIDVGTFSLSDRSHPGPGPLASAIPRALLGNTYVFSDGDTRERLDFVTAVGGRAIDRAQVMYFTYAYSPASDSATTTISLPGDISVEFEMHFGSGTCGTYERRELLDGVLEHTSEGVFSCASSVYHSSGAESTDVTLPADELSGRTYVMSDGGTPCHLQFQTHASGKCIQGQQIDDIDYDYVVNCNATSTITVRFGAGEYDSYRLNHSDETFMRHEVRGGLHTDTDTGTFSEAP